MLDTAESASFEANQTTEILAGFATPIEDTSSLAKRSAASPSNSKL